MPSITTVQGLQRIVGAIKTLGIKLPEDITNAEKLSHGCNSTTSKNGFVLKAYATELRMVIIGLLAHTPDHSLKATAAYRSYPHGTAGYAWRWYGEQVDNPTILPDGNELNKVGSPTQHKVTFLDCGNVLAISLGMATPWATSMLKTCRLTLSVKHFRYGWKAAAARKLSER